MSTTKLTKEQIRLYIEVYDILLKKAKGADQLVYYSKREALLKLLDKVEE